VPGRRRSGCGRASFWSSTPASPGGDCTRLRAPDRLEECADRENPHSIRPFHLNTGFFKEKCHGLFKRPGDGPGTLHLHRETTQAYLDQITAEAYVYRKPKKGRGRGLWCGEPKAEGRANHYGDTLFGAFAIADMKNCRTLPKREVLAARLSQLRQQQQKPAGGGVRMPDGRSFLATQRR
jgi:hypothetical protein